MGLTNMESEVDTPTLPQVQPATDEQAIAYLRYSRKYAEVAASAEQDALILQLCDELGITVSEDELQAAGDIFRKENKLLETSETLSWLAQQRISVEDWSKGIYIALLAKKLKEHIGAENADNYYMGNRDRCNRVALSQILVQDLTTAMKVAQMLSKENASFCALALDYSKGKQSKDNGGFVGVRFIAELLPELARAIIDAKEGEIIGPVQSKLGYHVLRIEKSFPPEFSQVREQILDFLFQDWLRERANSESEDLVHNTQI
jgi:parvulin-like peptidyl-prolyl isomerase